MTGYILRRLSLLVPVLLIVGVIAFGLVHITPGDPASIMAGEEASPQQVEEMRERMGLNEPLYTQFITWFADAARLDFGESIFLRQPVSEAMADRAEPTFLLTVYALGFALLISIPTGVIAAVNRNSYIDRLLMVFSIGGAAIPNFFLGICLILLFGVILGWFPVGGYVDITENPLLHFERMLMPSVALGIATAGLLARMVRSTMLDVLREDYVRTAFSKGLPNRRVVLRHALRNALIPAMTVLGISFANLLSGSIVVESVFNLPGMGRLVVTSITRRDFPVIQGTVMVIATIQVLVMLLIDILYVYIDPRIRYGTE